MTELIILWKAKLLKNKINIFKKIVYIYNNYMNNIDDIIEENKLLKAKNNELEEKLKKYTNST